MDVFYAVGNCSLIKNIIGQLNNILGGEKEMQNKHDILFANRKMPELKNECAYSYGKRDYGPIKGIAGSGMRASDIAYELGIVYRTGSPLTALVNKILLILKIDKSGYIHPREYKYPRKPMVEQGTELYPMRAKQRVKEYVEKHAIRLGENMYECEGVKFMIAQEHQ